MAINLNFNAKPDYGLRTGLIDEMIQMYGTKVRFVPTRKIQDFSDWFIGESGAMNKSFDDFKTVIPESFGTEEFFVLLNETSEFPNGLQFMFGQFGLQNDDTLQVFVSLRSLEFLSEPDKRKTSENVSDFSRSSEFFGNLKTFVSDKQFSEFPNEVGNLKEFPTTENNAKILEPRNFKAEHDSNVVHPRELISNLLVFPNGKVMEITDCQMHVQGTNNKFVYSNLPSCYMLSLKSYSFDRSAVRKSSGKLQETIEIRDDFSEFPNFEITKSRYGSKTTETSSKIDEFFNVQETRSSNIKDEVEVEVLTTDERTLQDKTSKQKIDDVFGIFG